MFSSPRLHASRRQVYAASLGGRLLCLSIVSEGHFAIWCTSGNKKGRGTSLFESQIFVKIFLW